MQAPNGVVGQKGGCFPARKGCKNNGEDDFLALEALVASFAKTKSTTELQSKSNDLNNLVKRWC